MHATAALLVVFAAACAPAARRAPVMLLREPIAGSLASWTVIAPSVRGALARPDGDAIALSVPAGSSDTIIVRRTLEIARVRGQRLRLTLRVKTEGATPSVAKAGLRIQTAAALPAYRDFASTRAIHAAEWTTLETAIDVAPDATAGQLDLIWTGAGTARFAQVELAVLGPSPRPAPRALSPRQIADLVSLTQAAALVQFLHPSDEAAGLDWQAFWPDAIERVLAVTSRAQLIATLQAIFAPIAPTVSFNTKPALLASGAATHLVRWQRYGFGADEPYKAFREGRDRDAGSVSATLQLPMRPGCKKLALYSTSTGRKLDGSATLELWANLLQGGVDEQDHAQAMPDGDASVTLDADVPADAQAFEVGFHLQGRGELTVKTLALACDGGSPQVIDLARSAWKLDGDSELYEWHVATCDAQPCVTLGRKPLERTFAPARDIVRRELGDGIAIEVPLAVWATSERTLPAGRGELPHARFTIDDPEMRLATIAAAWATLATFYPYFADQHIDWRAALPGAFAEAALARSPAETQAALAHLLARAHDSHISLKHPAAPRNGILPLAFRRVADKVIVQGGVPGMLDDIAIGSELVEMEDVPALAALRQLADQASAATAGAGDYLAELRLGMGNVGTFRRLRIRDRDGRTTTHTLPLVATETYRRDIREPRPANGSELAPGVLYLDLDTLSKPAWDKLLPAAQQAKALVLDLRGYVGSATSGVIAHLADHPLASPILQTPRLPATRDHAYQVSRWAVRPQAPTLAARVVVLIDARTMSASETYLQILHDHHLAVLVGETSAGTNGNVADVELPAGFTFRFTAMRVIDDAGWTLQGHGFTPDHVVHPTLEGVRAGRDEILQAGIAIAQRLIAP